MFSVVNTFEKVVVDTEQIDYLYLICITKSINTDINKDYWKFNLILTEREREKVDTPIGSIENKLHCEAPGQPSCHF